MKHFNTFSFSKNAFSKCPFLLAGLLLTFAFPSEGWGGSHSTHYGKVTVTKTGEGSVYIGTTNTATPGNTTATWDCGGDSGKDSKTYYLFATPDAANHYYFEKWEGNNQSSTQNPWQITTPSATGSSTSNPSNTTYTATFKLLPKFYFAAGAEVDPAGNGTGKVAVAYSSTEPDAGSFSASPVGAKTDKWADNKDVSSMTATAYYFAKADAGMTFMGWYDENGVQKTTNTTYFVLQTSTTKTDDATPEVYFARFRDPSIKFDPAIELAGQDGATEVTLKVDDEQVVSFVNVDNAVLSTLKAPVITVVNRVDVGSEPIVEWDADNLTLTANRAGTATVTFSHPATDGYNAGNFTFTIHVEKLDATFSWKTSVLLAGQSYTLTDLVETPSDGAWNIVSSKESVFASISQAGTQSATASMGTVTLTFSQGISYRYNAIPAASQEFKVYTDEGFATYLVNGITYTDFAVALTEANKLSKNKYVIVNSDGALIPGNYTIPSGVSVIVPHKSGASLQTTPEVTTTAATLEAYRTWKILEGTNITVNGNICVCGKIMSGSGGASSCYPTGACGVIDMSTGGHIELNNGAKLYCWGFVRGQGYLDGNNTQNVGTITANNNTEVWEDFFVGDFRGGTASSTIASHSSTWGFFPFQSYSVQNIEIPVTYKYGSTSKVYVTVHTKLGDTKTTGTVIGTTNSLFTLKDSQSTVRKWYDATTDLVNYELSGTASLKSLKVKVYIDVDSKDYYLPINNSMQINIDCDMELTSPMTMHAGSVIKIMPGRTVTLSSKLHVFDQDDWGLYMNKAYFRSMGILTPHVSRGAITSKDNLADAKIIVDGKLIVTSAGKLYTTAGGADIMSHGDGQIVYQGGVPTDATLTSCTDVSTEATNTITAAKLHNENDSYTASISSTTFDNLHGRWFTHAAATILDANHMYDFTFIGGTSKCFYSADKTGLTAGYKWVDLKETDNAHTCGGTMTFVGKDDNLYTFKNGEWLQLVQIAGGTTYSGSDDNLYQFLSCDWVSLGEIGDDCMYTVEGVKKAVVGSDLVALEKDEYDEVYVKTTDHSDYYMLFDGCVWQHAEKVPDTYKAYLVLGNYYVWIDNTWTEVEQDGEFFYTTDDQGLKHYYEYDGDIFAWVPVKDKVLITTATGDEMGFRNWDDAMLYVGQFNNPIVTLLADVATTSIFTITGSAKTTDITIDLNDHVLDANVAAQAFFLKLNNSKVTLTITDNSDHQRGELKVTCSVAKRVDAINVTAGKVVMEASKVSIHNANNTSSGNAAAIYAAAGQSVTVNGGELEAISTRYAYGIYSASSAALASTSIITMNGGTINATSKDYAYGIISYGIINMNGGTINATTTTVNGVAGANYAYGIYANVSSNATASSCYYATVNMTGGVINATAQTTYAEGIFANAGQTLAGANNYIAYTNKASAKLNITGGEINAKCLTSTTAYGVYAIGTENSNGSSAKHIIKDCKITASATGTAYGVFMGVAIADLSVGKLFGDVEIENADVYAETTSASTAAAVCVNATNTFFSRAKYNNGTTGISAANKKLWYVEADPNDGDLTHEGIAVSGDGAKKTYKYMIGGHGVGAKITIKSGNFRAKSAYQYAYGAYAVRSLCLYDGTEGRGEITILGGTFTAETAAEYAYVLRNAGIMNIKGGTFNSIAGTSTSYGVYAEAGLTTIDGGTFNIDATTTIAYGVMATGVIEGNTGFENRGEVVINNGVFNAHALGTTTAAGVYATGTYVELNQTKYDARTAANKEYYYAVAEDGKILTNATKANYYPYQYGVHTVSGKITVNGGTFNAKAFTTTAIGAYANMSSAVRADMIGRQGVARGEFIIHGGEFNSETETGATAEGIRSYGIVNVDGGTFNVKSKTTAAYGLYVMDGTTTIDGGTFNIAAGTNTAVGLRAHVYANNEYGYYVGGEAIVNAGTFNVDTWGGNTAYGVYVTGAAGAYSATKSTTYTGTKPASYAVAGRATINGGTFIMNPSTGVDAYGFVLEGNKVNGDSIAYPKCEVLGGFFQMKGTGVYAANTNAVEDAEGNQNLAIKGGHFSTNKNLAVAKPKDYVRTPYTVINCVEDAYKATYPYEVTEAYTITFKDDEGNILWSGLQPKGSLATYPLTNGTPEKAATSTNSFDFTGWAEPLAEVTADKEYIANFTAVAKRFMVTWTDDMGVEIGHKEYASGETPELPTPEKEGYHFKNWTPAISAVVDQNQTYKAVFEINQYTIRWVDEDGTLIREDQVNHGATPTKPANPTKEGYSFQAWNPGVVKATEDVTYTATYLLNLVTLTKAGGSPVPYVTFASALTEANKADGGTMTLLQDVKVAGAAQSFTKSTTLDLNGHSLRGAVNKLITVNGTGKTVTVKDSKGGGMIDDTYAYNGQVAAVYVTEGTFVLESGTIRVENPTTSSSASYYAAAVYVPASQSFVMNGGTLTSIANNDYAYGVYNLGTATIHGGTINTQALNHSYGVRADNTTTINDVTINANAIRTTYGVAVWNNAAGKTITINGGTFNGNATTTTGYAIDATAASTINVNGGKFMATTKPISNTGGATIKVAGGFYDKDTELAGMASPKKVVALVSEPEKVEGYNYKIVDAAYQVTFLAEDGTVLQQANVEAGVRPVFMGEEPTKPSNPKYSYEFIGWSDGVNTYAAAEIPVANAAATYTAVFIEHGVEYPITFYNIDGKGGTYVQMVEYGTVPVYNGPAPFSSGNIDNVAYIFNGWSPALVEVTEPTTYEATFRLEIAVDVTFHANGRGVDPVALKVAKGAAIERPADQLVDCQHIEGWYTEAGCINEWNFASDLADETDINLYAKWATKTYTITWLDEFGDEIDQTIVNCNDVPTHANLYKPSTASYSYEFRGWNKTIVAANENATYKSLGFNQIAKRYAITFVTGSGATVINPIEQEVGSAIVAPADPTREGYTFVRWSPEIPSTMPAENMTIYAQWTANQYTITFDSNGGSAVTSITRDYNTTITAPANPTREGYTFVRWLPEIPSTMPAENITLTAQWTPVESGDYLDIVDWTSNSLTINMNGSSQKITIGTTTMAKNDREANRTMVFSGLSLAPGDDVLIAAHNNTTDALESFHTYKVPYIYTGTDINPGTTDEVWVKSGTWTVSGDRTIAKLVVCPGADVEITSGTLTVSGKLVLRTTPWEAAAISGEFAADQTYYTRIIEKNDAYYHFGLPLACNIDEVFLSKETNIPYGSTWILKSYNGDKRAKEGPGNSNWDYLEGNTPETKIIAANVGYEMFSNSKYYREFYFPVNPGDLTSNKVAAHAYPSDQGAQHQGWNALVASSMSRWYIDFDEPEEAKKVSELVALNEYWQHAVTEDQPMQPALPFYYQNATDVDELLTIISLPKTEESPLAAPRRAAEEDAVQTQWLRLNYADAQGVKDETNVYVHPTKFTVGFEPGYDVHKITKSGSRPLVYTQLDCGDLAFAAIPDNAQLQLLPLAVFSPAAGEYTFSLAKNRFLTRMANVWIFDTQSATIIDLLQSDYTVQVGEGTTASRFYLMGKFRAPQTPTDLDEINQDGQNDTDKPRKIIYDQHMYILYHNHIWDTNGRLIK